MSVKSHCGKHDKDIYYNANLRQDNRGHWVSDQCPACKQIVNFLEIVDREIKATVNDVEIKNNLLRRCGLKLCSEVGIEFEGGENDE